MYMDLFRKMKQNDLILIAVFAIYLITNMQLPDGLNELIDNSMGNIFIILAAMALFINSSPTIGILGFLVAYELIRRASVGTGTDAIKRYVETEVVKTKKMVSYQPSVPDITLEEEVIDKMVAFADNDIPQTNVQPVLENYHNAEQL
jgi:hypothetical protein